MRALAVALLVVLPAALAGCTKPDVPDPPKEKWPKHDLLFDGDDAYDLVKAQVLAPDGTVQYRVPGTPSNGRVAQWIENELALLGARTEYQSWGDDYACKKPTPLRNVVGTVDGATNRTVVVSAHYDTRPVSDKDSAENRSRPVPGANDGASGVAVALELAKVLKGRVKNLTVIYAFYDAEDGGDLPRDVYPCQTYWIKGALEFVRRYDRRRANTTEGVIVIDMVGDKDLMLRRERFSADGPGRPLQDAIWSTGRELGYGDIFLDDVCCNITDDHRAFLEAPAILRFGHTLPAVDIIHLDEGPDVFPDSHHTQSDDLDHVSPDSLEVVGRTVEHVLLDLDRTPLATT